MMADLVLAADIGATNTRLRLVAAGELASALEEEKYKDMPVQQAIEAFIDRIGARRGEVRAACFGVAGRVIDGDVRMTNRPKEKITDELLAQGLGLPRERVLVVNDMVTHMSGVDHSEAIPLRGGRQEGRVEGIVMPGTGLGVGYAVVGESGDRTAMPSEGGHLDFGAPGQHHDELVSWARTIGEVGRISWEWLVSGPGLARIYECLRAGAATGEYVEPEQVTAAALGSKGGLDRETAQRATRVFVELSGARAGNLCLDVLATRGMYFGGNLLNMLHDHEPRRFCELISRAFDACGPDALRGMMRDVPLWLIRSADSGLRGAAALALSRIRAKA